MKITNDDRNSLALGILFITVIALGLYAMIQVHTASTTRIVHAVNYDRMVFGENVVNFTMLIDNNNDTSYVTTIEDVRDNLYSYTDYDEQTAQSTYINTIDLQNLRHRLYETDAFIEYTFDNDAYMEAIYLDSTYYVVEHYGSQTTHKQFDTCEGALAYFHAQHSED